MFNISTGFYISKLTSFLKIDGDNQEVLCIITLFASGVSVKAGETSMVIVRLTETLDVMMPKSRT